MVCLTTVSDRCTIIAIFYKYQSCVFLWQFVGFLKPYIGIWKKKIFWDLCMRFDFTMIIKNFKRKKKVLRVIHNLFNMTPHIRRRPVLAVSMSISQHIKGQKLIYRLFKGLWKIQEDTDTLCYKITALTLLAFPVCTNSIS